MVRVRAFIGGLVFQVAPGRPLRPGTIVYGGPIWDINRGMAAWPGAIRAAGPADPPFSCQN